MAKNEKGIYSPIAIILVIVMVILIPILGYQVSSKPHLYPTLNSKSQTAFYYAVTQQNVTPTKTKTYITNTPSSIPKKNLTPTKTQTYITNTPTSIPKKNVTLTKTKTYITNTSTSIPISIKTSTQSLNYKECKEYSNGYVTCIIKKAHCSYMPSVSNQPTFCNDSLYPSNSFTYLVWGQNIEHLDGHCIIIKGSVEIYKEKPEITSEDNSGFIGYCD